MIKSKLSSITAIIITVLICSSFLIPEQIPISGKIPWTKTKYTIGIGDKIELITMGDISPIANVKCNPDGVPNKADLQTNFGIIKTSNFGCLIGKIGENGSPFYVGTNLTITSESNGDLYLGINDTDLKDNSGEFLTIVTISPINTTQSTE
mgnify:CR=1 FL=1